MILIADDSALNRKLLAAACDALGHRTREVTNGQEALDAASHELYAFILMDVMMPVMDGLEATRRIRALPAPLGRARIIGITALDRGALERQGRAAGMNAVLGKPVRIAELLSLLRHCGACVAQDCATTTRP